MKARLPAVIPAGLALLTSPLSAGETFEFLTDSAGKVVTPFTSRGSRDVGFESWPFGWATAHGHWFNRSGGKIRDLDGCPAKPPTTVARALYVFPVEKDGKWGYAKIVRP